MKLSKLYCNDKRFKNIAFNLNGLNVIYADVVTKMSEKKNSHNLGKSKLLDLIDYLLIKKIDKNNFLLKTTLDTGQQAFGNHIFYLELFLNSGDYLTIKREIKRYTKTSFSINNQTTDEFTPPSTWEYENLGIEAAKKVLSEYLAFDFFNNKLYDYRKAINYCMRLQPDYDDVYKLSKFKGGDIDWKPFMFDLLGFDGEILTQKYLNDQKQTEIDKEISKLKSDFLVDEASRDEIIAQINLQEGKTKEASTKIDQLNFYDQDKRLIETGVDEIENSISELNTLSYSLNFDINKLRNSIKNNISLDLIKVEKIFNEARLYFPDDLKKEYLDLIHFNEELTKERNKLLKSTLLSKQEILNNINEKLEKLNEEKKSLMSFLQDTDVFKRLKYYQKELSKLESELMQLKERLKIIDIIINKEKDKLRIKKEIEETVNKIKSLHSHTEDNERYKSIRTMFSEYYHDVMNEDAYISWSVNTSNNVDFKPPVIRTKGKQSKSTAKDEGHTYRKILCVAFDLSVLAVYNHESYFRFVYHDDVLSQQDNGVKIRFLALIDAVTSRYDIQYILSVIKSDLPTDSNDKPMYFDSKDVILKLNDKGESGTLFGFEF